MAFRRGFKTEANSLGREIRTEFKIGPFDRMDPFELAANLEVTVLTLTELSASSPAISHLITNEPEVFSAVTVFCGPRRTIVHNDGHSEARQNSNLTHELAHALLHHPPSAALDDKGCRNWSQDIEDEANWLAGILLVSEEMTIAVARGRFTQTDAAWKLGVSKQMIMFRMNATGAKKRVQRANETWHN